jgi:hypothetical protein
MKIKERQPPDWFVRKNYSYLKALDLRGWRDELLRVNTLVNSPLDDWEAYLVDENSHVVRDIIGPPTVELIDRREEGQKLELHALELPALVVHLDQPDGVIIDEVKKALALARKKYPSRIAARGPKAQNAKFGDRNFSTWLTARIVELSELMAWNKEQPRDKRVSGEQIGKWLYPGHEDVKRTEQRSRTILRKALASLPEMNAQVVAKTKTTGRV